MDAARVSFVQGSQLCSSSGSITHISLQLPVRKWGTLIMVKTASMIVDSRLFGVRAKGAFSRIYTPAISSARSKEVAECSNRGTCDRQKGVCQCFKGYSSSDGRGRVGLTGDCGYMETFLSSYSVNGVSFTSPCPVANGKVCGGNGYCDENTGTCSCYEGFGKLLILIKFEMPCNSLCCMVGGANCTQVLCPVTTAWFGLVGQNHTLKAECAGIGYCDHATGTCSNCGGISLRNVFGGSGCHLLSCPKEKGLTCG